MPLPRKLQVGAIEFSVTAEPAEYNAEASRQSEHFWGSTNFRTCETHIQPEQAEPQKRVTMLHETLHCVWRTSSDATPKSMNEEEIVQRLAGPLLDTLRRNPELLNYLLEK